MVNLFINRTSDLPLSIVLLNLLLYCCVSTSNKNRSYFNTTKKVAFPDISQTVCNEISTLLYHFRYLMV